MCRLICLSFFAIILVQISFAQVKVDSLKSVWESKNNPDSIRLAAINTFAWSGYLFRYPDSAFYFAQKQYEFAASTGDSLQMGNALNTQGVSFLIRGDVDKAKMYNVRQEGKKIHNGDFFSQDS